MGERLTQRGLIPAGALGTVLFSDAALASVPAALVEFTAQAAIRFATSPSLTAGAVSLSATVLAKGILRDMIITRLSCVGITLAAIMLATGAGVLTFRASASQDQISKMGPPSHTAGPVGTAAGPIHSHAELLSAQIRVCRKAYEQANTTRNGKDDLEKLYLWSQRLMQAQIATAVGSYVTDPKARAVCVAAAKGHLDRMRRLEEDVRPLVDAGKDVPLSASTAEYYRIEAEGFVLEYDRVADPSHR